MKLNEQYLVPIKGDASHRQFYRKFKKLKKSIVIYSNREKKKNLLIYDSVNKILINNNLIAPKLISNNYSKNFIEVNDLGTKTVLDIIKYKKNKIKIYKKIIDLLIKIQNIKTKKIKNFQGKIYKIPNYSNKKLFNEAKLFCDWYLPANYKKNKTQLRKQLELKIKALLSNLKQKNNVFVHRDFHLANLMITKHQLGIIDSQDAVLGNSAYDLASLIDDVRYVTSNKLKKNIYSIYSKKTKNSLNKSFLNDFEILSVLRNLKIIGIFTRLAKRDNKKFYLKLIPHAWKLIDLRCRNNPILKDFRNFLLKYFPNKIRHLNEN